MWTDAQLAQLKVKDGFRLRGGEMTRLEALTDAAFALALTFLVISQQQIPHTYDELVAAFKQAPAFAASFAVLILFWSSHVRWSRRYGLEDGGAVALSCLLIFVVLIFVYPLKMVFGAFFAHLSGGWLPGQMEFHSMEEVRDLFLTYGCGFMLLALALWGLYADALRRWEPLRLNELERFDTRADVNRELMTFIIAAFATALALFLPARLSGFSGYAYSVFAVAMPVYQLRVDRRRKSLLARIADDASSA